MITPLVTLGTLSLIAGKHRMIRGGACIFRASGQFYEVHRRGLACPPGSSTGATRIIDLKFRNDAGNCAPTACRSATLLCTFTLCPAAHRKAQLSQYPY